MSDLTPAQKLALRMTDEVIADGLEAECEVIINLIIHKQEHAVAEHVGAVKSWAGMLRGRAEHMPPSAAPDMLEALKGAVGALEFSRDYHRDLGNEEQAFAQDKLDAVLAAISKAQGGAE